MLKHTLLSIKAAVWLNRMKTNNHFQILNFSFPLYPPPLFSLLILSKPHPPEILKHLLCYGQDYKPNEVPFWVK